MIYETRRLLNAREIVRIVGKGHVAFFPAWYFNYFRDICISSLSSTNISACQISNSDQISYTNLSDCLLQIWSDFGGMEMEMQKSVRNVEKCTFLLHLETSRADIIQRPSSTRHV